MEAVEEESKSGKKKAEGETKKEAKEQDDVVPKTKEGEEKEQPWYDRLSDSSKWLYARIKRSPHEPAPQDDSDAEEDYELPGSKGKQKEGLPRPSSSSLAPPPDDDPSHPPTLSVVLSEMGYDREQIQEAVKALDLEGPDETNPDVVQNAVLYLVSKDQESTPSSSPPHGDEKPPPLVVDVLNAGSSRAEGESLPAAASGSGESSQEGAEDGGDGKETKKPAAVVGAEAVTTPHWTERARRKLESTGAFKALDVGTSHLFTRGEKWLQGGEASKVAKK